MKCLKMNLHGTLMCKTKEKRGILVTETMVGLKLLHLHPELHKTWFEKYWFKALRDFSLLPFLSFLSFLPLPSSESDKHMLLKVMEFKDKFEIKMNRLKIKISLESTRKFLTVTTFPRSHSWPSSGTLLVPLSDEEITLNVFSYCYRYFHILKQDAYIATSSSC